jgi:hypothetical protein
MSTLAAYITEILARPDVRDARRRARKTVRRSATAPKPITRRALTHFAVKGSWRAEEIEPCLASPRSSLNPIFILGDGDEL